MQEKKTNVVQPNVVPKLVVVDKAEVVVVEVVEVVVVVVLVVVVGVLWITQRSKSA